MASPIPLDPYAVLGVPKDATLAAIRTAHRKLVLKCHPDKIKDENQRSQGQDEFQKVQQAYELLSDDAKRARYDQKVRLAELRKEAMERDGGSPSSPYAGMKSGSSGSFEYRGGRVYEERVPASARFFEEETRYTDEPRASARKHNDFAKRSVNRDVDDRKRSKHADPKVDPIRSSKERAREVRDSLKAGHEDRQKHRDRERRREASEKYSRATAFVESDDGSNSDGSYYRRRSSRRVYDDYPRKSKDSSARRHESRRSRDDDFTDEWGKHESLHVSAREYIQRSRFSAPTEVDTRRPRSSRSPTHYYEVRDSPQPDSARRSSARPRARDSGRPDSSGRERRGSIDIVEPLPRSHETRKPPTLATATSAPMAIKVPPVSTKVASPQPHRSSTTTHIRDRRDPPPVRRSETAPLFGSGSRRGEHVSSRSSKLKGAEISDSGYSSPGTPEMYQSGSPPKPTSKYTIVDEDEEYTRGHPTVLVTPDPSYRRQKSTSPIRPERPPPTVRPSPKPTRTATYAYPSDAIPPRQNLTRHESARAVPSSRNSPPLRSSTRDKLFGELSPDEQPRKFTEEQIRYSPRIRAEDVSYGPSVRKGSVDTGSAAYRDAYPRSQYEHHRTPGLGRSESYAY